MKTVWEAFYPLTILTEKSPIHVIIVSLRIQPPLKSRFSGMPPLPNPTSPSYPIKNEWFLSILFLVPGHNLLKEMID